MTKSEEETSSRKSKRPRSDDEEEDDEGPIEAEFLFNDPKEEDADSIASLLKGCLKGIPWTPPSSFEGSSVAFVADLISKQFNIGTVIATDDEEDSYALAVLSLLNLQQYEGLDSLVPFLLEVCKSNASKKVAEDLSKILTDGNNQVGLMLNERLTNIPPQLIGSLHQCLLDDVKWSLENSSDPDETKFYGFTHVVVLTRFYSKQPKSLEKENVVFVKLEDEFFVDEATLKFTWATGESNKVYYYDADGKRNNAYRILPEFGLLLVIPFQKYKAIVGKLKKTFTT